LRTESCFPSSHRYDKTFYLVMLIIIWAAILSGFINDIIQKNASGKLHFPIIVHVHAAAFVAWLLLFTTQVLLIRKGNYSLHKKLGIAGGVLAGVMVILGSVTGVVSEHVKYGTPDYDPAFLAVMFGDMLLFGILAGAGIALRKDASAHKRLMLLATIVLTDAGTGRWFSFKIAHFFGNLYWTYHTFAQGFLPYVGFQILSTLTLILTVGLYDIITRRKLHSMYVLALGIYLLVYLIAGWLYFNPEWLKIATKIIGH
jgi:ethanolamine utilization microcompartment shell protein EutS